MIETELRFCSICGAERDTPLHPLDSLAATPDRLAAEVRPSRAPRSGWTSAFVVAHLADTEVGFGWRIRQILSAEEPRIESFDEMRWAEDLRYAERDVQTSLEAFSAMRSLNVELLRLAGAAALERGYVHAVYGRRTLGDLVQHRADHDLQHLRQMVGQD